ncbi:MAG TPA: site-specific integrase [Rhizomicrobium sp.]|nr:site-specific integrase [Rhizomicrobium sp.]
MSVSLFDRCGHRKYLVASERLAFVSAALAEDDLIASFCLTLAVTGARISEVLALISDRVDAGNEAVVFETLKQREDGVFRAVPVPIWLLQLIGRLEVAPGERLWPWGRTHGWKIVKATMRKAGIPDYLCKPKALRHALGVEAGQQGIPLNITQRWLGHARIETTAIYAGAIGEEERTLARRAWKAIEVALPTCQGT